MQKLKKNWVWLSAMVLFIKVLYIVMGMVLYPEKKLTEAFKRHDSYWYEKIATEGHQHITPDQLGVCDGERIEQSYYAFFPLYPMMVNGVMRICSCSFDTAAFIFSIFTSILLVIAFYELILHLYQSDILALTASILLFVLPFNYYFSMYYSESLFLLLLLWSLISIRHKRWWWLAFFTSLLVISRPNGLFSLPVLFIFALETDNTRFSLKWLSIKRFIQTPWWIFILPTLVFFGYCYYLYIMTGDFFAYKTAQRGWCKESTLPWVPFLRIDTTLEWFHAIYLSIFSLFALFHFKKFPISINIFCWITIFLSLISGSLTLPRYISFIILFPMLFAILLDRMSTRVRYVTIGTIVILHLASYYLWVIDSEFSY